MPGSRRSPFARRFMQNRTGVIALAVVFLLSLVAAFGTQLAPTDPDHQDLYNQFARPSRDHLLGTDHLGRDILSRLLVAARVTMTATAQGLGLAILLGVPIGLLAGYARGVIDGILSRIADGFLALPPLVLALAIVGILGPGLTNSMIGLGIVLAPRFFRVARGAAQSIRSEMYIEAARADGFSLPRILFGHVLPNASGPLLVQASFGVGVVISAEASLSFLGLGVQPPTASWGIMIRQAFENVYSDSFAILPPSVFVVVTVLAFFLVGDALADALGRGQVRK